MPDQLQLALAIVFLGVAAVAGITASIVLARTSPERRRIRDLATTTGGTFGPGTVSLTDAPDRVAKTVATFVPKSPKEMGRLQRRLTRAGYPGARAAAIYALAEMLLPVVF